MVKINVNSLFSVKNGSVCYVYGMLCVNELTLLVLYNIKNDCVCAPVKFFTYFQNFLLTLLVKKKNAKEYLILYFYTC